MSEAEVVEAEVVEPGAEIVPVPPTGPMSLFRTDDPAEVLKRAKETADALAPVIRSAGLVVNIQGKDYLTVEAWQTLGQQVGVTGVVTSTTRIEGGWEAHCEARTLDGRTIGAADSMCSRDEVVKGKERWKEANEFEIRSMAQTRAMSRALASVLRFIPTLAGMSGTPAEEMGRVAAEKTRKGFASDKQRGLFAGLLKDAGLGGSEIAGICDFMNSTLSSGAISKSIDGLKDDARRAKGLEWLRDKASEFADQLAVEAEGGSFPDPDDKGEDTPL